jgi:starch synthase
MKILFAASEASPLIKTGGLADVAGSLPASLIELGAEVRVIIPAYRGLAERLQSAAHSGTLVVPGVSGPVKLLSGRLDARGPLITLVDAPDLYHRDGGPYTDRAGRVYPDNAHRFAVLSRVVTALALGQGGDGWRPDVVHCNDWQTGLVPALLAREWNRPATVFTIHNLAYQGVFDFNEFRRLELPDDLWSIHGLEFHGNFSFVKGGIAFADVVTTVSPTYASEICTPELGYGLEGLLGYREDRLFGVLNGIDTDVWDPAQDPHIPAHYDADRLGAKAQNKRALQAALGLPERDEVLLFGHIGRLVEQKGADLIISVLPRLLEDPNIQVAILGSGEPHLEAAIHAATEHYPEQVGAFLGYDEPLSHLLEAGSDCFLMPSRFEPCGLNQMYSLRYGTIPIVHRTGGLADTVVDASTGALFEGTANGFVFEHANVDGLWSAIERATQFRQRPRVYWEKMQRAGMAIDFSWRASAERYLDLYRFALDHPAVVQGMTGIYA